MTRYWLVTWTTYGSWLPGDRRGYIDGNGQPGTPFDGPNEGLENYARSRMKQAAVHLTKSQAKAIFEQLEETTSFRNWQLVSVAIMSRHLHLVLRVFDDPDPHDIIRDLKSYCSRRLNKGFPNTGSRKWWTKSGSTRKLPNQQAVSAAIEYLERQENPLVLWVHEEYRSTNET